MLVVAASVLDKLKQVGVVAYVCPVEKNFGLLAGFAERVPYFTITRPIVIIHNIVHVTVLPPASKHLISKHMQFDAISTCRQYKSTVITSHCSQLWLLGSVVVGCWTCDREVAGSTPGRCIAGQVVHTHVPLSPSSIIWYRPRGGDVLRLWR